MRQIITADGIKVRAYAEPDRKKSIVIVSKMKNERYISSEAGEFQYFGPGDGYGFTPTSNHTIGYSPETLRAIADLLEGENQ